jgi:hypothetical protein
MKPCFPDFTKVFTYKDGELYRNGKIAGTVTTTGYKQVYLDKKVYLAHRVIFAMHWGFLPQFIDHIDGNRLNNKIENLRQCTQQQNQYNTKAKAKNKVGIKNVQWARNTYRVDIRINGKLTYLGSFKDVELAELVAQEARKKYHGEFAHV